MNISYHQLATQSTIRALNNLSHLLNKAVAYCAEKEIKEEVLLQARLFPNMYPLTKQVQIASDMSKSGAARLTGAEPPSFPDTETTFAELQQRITKTIDYLKSVQESAFVGADKREIKLPWYPEVMTGETFLLQHVLPNLYFHVTTAYNILRHNGVVLGKADFIGGK